MAQSLQLFQQNHGFFAEWPDCGPPQSTDMAKTAQSAAEIAGERPHIGAFAAFGFQHRMIGVGIVDELEAADLDRAGGEFHRFAVARKIVGALALDLDR